MRIRHLDWVSALPPEQHQGLCCPTSHSSGTAPPLEGGATFDVIIGSDLLYEVSCGPCACVAPCLHCILAMAAGYCNQLIKLAGQFLERETGSMSCSHQPGGAHILTAPCRCTLSAFKHVQKGRY